MGILIKIENIITYFENLFNGNDNQIIVIINLLKINTIDDFFLIEDELEFPDLLSESDNYYFSYFIFLRYHSKYYNIYANIN
jgi:hypothetical protein